MKLSKKITLAIIILLSTVFLSTPAQAKNELNVKYVTGEKLSSKKTFDADNIYPGWSESKIIRVENESKTAVANLYLKFKQENKRDLAKKIKIYVKRISDGSYRIGGSGDHWTLQKAQGKNLYIDKLNPSESEYYKITLLFDKESDNDYQNLSVKFDLRFNLQADASNENEKNILISQERSGFTGQPPEENNSQELNETTQEETVPQQEEVLGISEEKPETATVADSCSSWPLFKWILLLIGYLLIFNFNSFRNSEEKEEKPRWFWQAAYSIITLILWYLFDGCRNFQWFPIVTVVTGLLSYDLYLKKLKYRK